MSKTTYDFETWLQSLSTESVSQTEPVEDLALGFTDCRGVWHSWSEDAR